MANNHKICNKKKDQKGNNNKKIFDIGIIKNNKNNKIIITIIGSIYIFTKSRSKKKKIEKK
jgi:hypothetical protein